MNAARGKVLVRPVETAETIAGGRIIIPEAVREKFAGHQMLVVDVGQPTACDDEDCDRPHDGDTHPIDPRVTRDAWVVVRHRSLVDASHPTDTLYFVGQDDVLAVLRDA